MKRGTRAEAAFDAFTKNRFYSSITQGAFRPDHARARMLSRAGHRDGAAGDSPAAALHRPAARAGTACHGLRPPPAGRQLPRRVTVTAGVPSGRIARPHFDRNSSSAAQFYWQPGSPGAVRPGASARVPRAGIRAQDSVLLVVPAPGDRDRDRLESAREPAPMTVIMIRADDGPWQLPRPNGPPGSESARPSESVTSLARAALKFQLLRLTATETAWQWATWLPRRSESQARVTGTVTVTVTESLFPSRST